MTSTVRVLTPAVLALALGAMTGCASHPKLEPTAVATKTSPSHEPPAYRPPPIDEQSGIAPGSTQDFVVNAGDRVYFDFDQFNIRSDAMPVLAAQATWLNRYPTVQVRIEGNCDERGTEEYNFALGARRANSVRVFLIEHGVSASRIATVSYGKARPIDTGNTEEAWMHDRNAHTAIIAGAR
jgi:peptidoglycan-associated lipoprotein